MTIDPRSDIVSRPEDGVRTLREFFPALLGPDGVLLFNAIVHDASTRSGYDRIRGRLSQHVPGAIPDTWFVPEQRRLPAIAQQPVIAGRYASIDFYLDQRNSPPLFGVGIIDAISSSRILQIAERQARESQGAITGRFTGKFGWRGQGQTLSQFVSDACVLELGLTHGNRREVIRGIKAVAEGPAPVQPRDPADPSYANAGLDMASDEFQRLVSYVRSLPQPVETVMATYTTQKILAGEKLFFSVGCEACHVADIQPALGLFSDLLLHDMGPELQAPSPAPIGSLASQMKKMDLVRFEIENPVRAAGREYYGNPPSSLPMPSRLPKPRVPRFPRGDGDGYELSWDALQREWRTPPLWGVADSAPYLHDGRAATLDEAIMLHGGEAEASRKRFSALAQADKELLLAFLSTLRAPRSDD